jgi:serine/threonine protein kinase
MSNFVLDQRPEFSKTGVMQLISNRRIIKCFYMVSRLGDGGLGSVFLCKDVPNEARFHEDHEWPLVAVKIFHPADYEMYELILENIDEMRKKNFPYIAEIFETFYYNPSFENDAKLVLSMRYYEEGDLTKLIYRPQPIPQPTIISMFYQLLMGLRVFHERKQPLIHRDISLDNCLISKIDGESITVVLSDFDTIKEVLYTCSNSKGVGKYEYYAPEVITGIYGSNADIFSLGIVFFELMACQRVTNVYPNGLANVLNLSNQELIHNNLYNILVTRKYDVKLIQLVLSMLKYNQSERHSAAAYISMLENFSKQTNTQNGLFIQFACPHQGCNKKDEKKKKNFAFGVIDFATDILNNFKCEVCGNMISDDNIFNIEAASCVLSAEYCMQNGTEGSLSQHTVGDTQTIVELPVLSQLRFLKFIVAPVQL